LAGQLRELGRCIQGDAALPRRIGKDSIDGSGIEEMPAQFTRQKLRDRALAEPLGPSMAMTGGASGRMRISVMR